jgi:DNA polymerase-3 subunit gamma/tau
VFSPFEADRNRKITGDTGLTVKSQLAAPEPEMSAPAPAPARTLTPLEVTAKAVETATLKVPVATVVEMPMEATEGALALATEPRVEITPQQNGDLDRIREAVCTALEQNGHNTAAVLLDSGKWALEGDTIRVEVGIKKTMLGLSMNVDADKIARNTLRSSGVQQKLLVAPGEGAASSAPAKSRSAASGSVQAAALENPLVKKAMDLFSAEVRSVLDLRDKN